MIWSRAFWKGAAERGIKTFAQALAAVLSAGVVGLLDADWGQALSVAALAAVLSVLTSIGDPGFVAGPDARRAVDGGDGAGS